MIAPATLLSFEFNDLKIPRREILRYMGVRSQDEPKELTPLVDRALCLVSTNLSLRAAVRTVGMAQSDGVCTLGPLNIKGRTLSRALSGCSEAALFACTVGPGLDRLISRESVRSGACALAIDAVGSAAVEALCNLVCLKISDSARLRGLFARPRVSPGYGDIPLNIQSELLSFVDAFRLCSISLTQADMMTPTKSVSAIVGLGSEPCPSHGSGCSTCPNLDCTYRRQE